MPSTGRSRGSQWDLLPPSQGMQTLSIGRRWGGWCSSQFLQKETQADVQGCVWPACGLPPTLFPQLDSALVWGLCQMSSQCLIPPKLWPRDEFWYSKARAAALSSEQPWLGGASQGHGLDSPLAKHISLSQPGWRPGSKGSVSLLCQHLEEKGGK